MKHLNNLKQLEAEAIHILREVAASFDNPCMFYSIGKDSTVMLHLARKAFYPGEIPFTLVHVDTTWEFAEMGKFRDELQKKLGFDLIVHINQEAIDMGIHPIASGSVKYNDFMKTIALKQALDEHQFDAALGGARRDEEKSRAKERVFSVRNANHQWDPKQQRPELWSIYNSQINKGESVRVFPLSNWTELDIWFHCTLRLHG
jgi:sulfate adenylyltransferase subunit 2